MTLTDLETLAWERHTTPGRWGSSAGVWLDRPVPNRDAMGSFYEPASGMLTATIRTTRNTQFVQFTWLGRRISRERAQELLEGSNG